MKYINIILIFIMIAVNPVLSKTYDFNEQAAAELSAKLVKKMLELI